MRRHSISSSLRLGASLSLAAVISACTLGVDLTEPPGTSGGGGNGGAGAVVTVGATASVTAGASSSVSAGSSGAGAGGGAPATYGLGATELVSAGGLTKSPNYKLMFTLGQPSIQQNKAASPSYRMQGGLEGANGSLP